MGQAPSCNQVGGNIDTLTNAQIRDNIENLFRSPNTNTVKIENTDNGYATSVVEVDTIAPLKGGNKSRVSVMPKRQRFKTVPIKMRGGTHENLDEDDLKALKKVLYHNAEPEQSDTELKSETVQPAEQTYVDSATSELRSDEELVADENEPQPPHPQIADDLLKQVPEQASEQAPEKVSEQVPEQVLEKAPEQVPEPVVESVQPDVFQSNLVGGTQSEYSIDKEISMIRSFISNTIKQRGGEPTVVDDDNDILSEEGLATIRESLAKNGVQIGGNVDEELKIFKDNILNSAQAFALSATSSEQSSLLTNLKGGAKPAEKKNKKEDEDDDDNEDEDDEETEEDEDEDEEEDEDDYDEEDGMSGGDHSKDSSSSSDSDSSKSDSSSSSNSSSSSSSDSSVTNSAVAVMHNAINKNMDRKNNKSKYLQENGYKVTTNSDRDYKINNRPMYSSQSSDVYSNIGGSDYLNSMRNRDRSF